MAAALGLAHALDGRVAVGLSLVEHGVEQQVAMGISRSLALVVAWLSEAYLPAGRLEEARQASPAVEPATGYYRQALALAEELVMHPLQAHGHRGLGMLYGNLGQQEQARRELSTAIELYCAMEMTFWLPQVEAALVQMA